jgi:hypothetical protein
MPAMLSLRVDSFDVDALRAAYDEVYVYTMSRPGFILQHDVDAFAVQTANTGTKPIGVVFGLVGPYLHVERQFSGHQVQMAPAPLFCAPRARAASTRMRRIICAQIAKNCARYNIPQIPEPDGSNQRLFLF